MGYKGLEIYTIRLTIEKQQEWSVYIHTQNFYAHSLKKYVFIIRGGPIVAL
jgi:hypothetical protein